MSAVDPTMAYRTEVEVAANTVVALKNAGMLAEKIAPGELLAVTGLTADDLRLALVRAERVPARRLAPQETPARPVEPAAVAVLPGRVTFPQPPVGEPDMPPGDQYVGHPSARPLRLVPRARQACAERIFAEWRARGNLDCTRCGKPIYSGHDAIIEAAHHADHCPT